MIKYIDHLEEASWIAAILGVIVAIYFGLKQLKIDRSGIISNENEACA